MSDADRDRKLRELHREAHRADEPPPFRPLWSAVRLQASGPGRERRLRRWLWAPAAALVVVLSLAAGLRIRGVQRQRDLAQQISLWAARDPLGFLLETPGGELLRQVPSFDSKGEWQ